MFLGFYLQYAGAQMDFLNKISLIIIGKKTE